MGSSKGLIATVVGVTSSASAYYYYSKQPSVPKQSIVRHADSRPFRLLSEEMIAAKLRSGQFVTKVSSGDVQAVYTNQLASNAPVEDTFSLHALGTGLIAGVYDGHVGPQCARLIQHQLPIYLGRELKESERPGEALIKAFVDLDDAIQQRFYALFPKSLEKASEKDIQDAVNLHPDPLVAQQTIDEAIHGSCALAVYIKEGVVYSANTGDSRVVIVSQEANGEWKGRRLVEEQSPADPKWRAHMVSQHPLDESERLIMKDRLFGLIAVGGSFGDILYKVPVIYHTKVLPFLPYDTYRLFSRYHHHLYIHSRTPPYLESKPLVSEYRLRKEDRFVILGTDGLWDEMSWPDIRSPQGDQAAAEIMRRWKPSGEANAATHLLRECLLLDAVYKNVRVKAPVEDPQLELSKRLTRQPSRHFRDDITITVIALQGGQPADLSASVGPVHALEQVDLDATPLVTPATPSSRPWYSRWIPSLL
ncbi:phosphatase 2C-like domain-containing protein [Sporodiniella umbellata]|nr:phosphatase 2C-like domain-containing protein [Sporodiniella umbellata]